MKRDVKAQIDALTFRTSGVAVASAIFEQCDNLMVLKESLDGFSYVARSVFAESEIEINPSISSVQCDAVEWALGDATESC